MKPADLFGRLEGYARENFTTEILAYCLDVDLQFRKAFLALLLQKQPKSVRAKFSSCTIHTQVRHSVGQPDLELRSADYSSVMVEIKTGAPETNGQISRYLKTPSAYVACISPLDFELKTGCKTHKRFLGQFFWHEIYAVLERSSRRQPIQAEFLKYLEVRHMGPIEPLTNNELKAAAAGIGFIRKAHALVEGVKDKIEPLWEKRFGANVQNVGLSSHFDENGVWDWWFAPKKWSSRKVCLSIGVALDSKGTPCFYVYAGAWQKGIWNQWAKHFLKVRKNGWQPSEPEDQDPGYYRFFPLKPEQSLETAIALHTKNVMVATKELLPVLCRMPDCKVSKRTRR